MQRLRIFSPAATGHPVGHLVGHQLGHLLGMIQGDGLRSGLIR
jgi:hypothetical protein